MLHVHHSNRMENLLEGLCRLNWGTVADPFRPEPIVVQNQGMARWVSQQLALRSGVSANLDFPLPASFLWRVLEAWVPELPEHSGFEKELLLWRILDLLPELLPAPEFDDLRRYLSQDDSGLRRYQLACRIAGLYDQYLVFRPDMVVAWERGADTHWQARLWRALGAAVQGTHRARLLMRLDDMASAPPPDAEALPPRVSLFGLTALAPGYVRVLQFLAGQTDVHVFFLNASREYWADLVDERGQARRRARARRVAEADATGLLDLGNPLLASMGHTGQVFLDQLLELEGEDHEWFEAPGRGSLLAQVQSDILELADGRIAPEARPAIGAADHSLQVHLCHSPLREVQVLHDQLLRLIEDLVLEPRDIIVMAPEIDRYAPYVDAVFGAAPAAQRIPWSLADRRLGAEQPVAAAVRTLLGLPDSRLPASEVLSLLQVPAVQRRFGLDLPGFERILAWVRESGIRWGEDGAAREAFGLPAEEANTWDFGLSRLFLGYAMTARDDGDPFLGIAPYPDVEGAEAEYLGILQDFFARLAEWRRRLAEDGSPEAWRSRIRELLGVFFRPDEAEAEVLQALGDRLDDLVRETGEAGFGQRLGLDVIRTELDAAMEDASGAHSFLTGRVTFCNMVPMRSIPFRVVCLLGLGDSDFPRSQRPPSFDLIARDPRRGDRSRRRDDRYLFLEALLSARDVFYLSYVGRDARDDSVRVPSVLVSELLDYVGKAFLAADGVELAARLTVHHPLQPFSRRYFDGSDARLFSLAGHWLEAARTSPESGIPPFILGPLDEPDPGLRTLEIDDLIRFLASPARYFLTHRLQLRLPEAVQAPEDTEPFVLDGLDRYLLNQALLPLVLEQRDDASIAARCSAGGGLPHGAPGALLLQGQLQAARQFAGRLEAFRGEPLGPLELDLELGGFRLQGQLDGLTTEGMRGFRLGGLRVKDRLGLWVRHLALNLLAPASMAHESRFLAQDQELRLAPVRDAHVPLQRLLEIRWQGLAQPLPFFPESSQAWLESGPDSTRFRHAWNGEHNTRPDAADAAVALAFRGRDPVSEPAFGELATGILAPLQAHATLTAPAQAEP